MKSVEKENRFYKKLKNSNTAFKHGEIEIISEFINVNTRVKVKTKYGTCSYLPSQLLNGRVPTIKTAINKTNYFKNKVKEVFGNTIDLRLVKYVGLATRVKVITKYGICSVYPSNLLNGITPTIRTAINPSAYSIAMYKEVHGDVYDYSKAEYAHSHNKIIIICGIHGEFKQSANSHLQGASCRKCGNLNNVSWSHTDWEKKAEDSKHFDGFKVYIIKCYDENEVFYKIGRTYQTVGRRFNRKRKMPYSYELIQIIKGSALATIKLENKLHKANEKYRYIPSIKFNGRQECYSKFNIEQLKLF